MATRARPPDPAPLGPQKTAIVLAIVVACFCVLWPRLLQPALQGPQPPAHTEHPATPPHKAPGVTYGGGAALRERGRTLGAPAPAPGAPRVLRAPPLAAAPPSPHAHRSRMAAPAPAGGAGAGAGGMGFVMPLYTAAVLIFFLYTLSKVVMKRSTPPPVPSATFREHVFNQHHHLVTDAVWGLCADVNRHHSNLRQHSPDSNHSQQNGNVDQTQRKLDRLLESDQEQQEDIRDISQDIKKVDLEEDVVNKPLEIKQVLEQIQLEEKQQLEKQHLEEKQLLEQRMHELELERLRREEEQRELEQLQIDEKEFEVEEKVQANGNAPQMTDVTTIKDEDANIEKEEVAVKPNEKNENEDLAVKTDSEEECVEEEEEEIEEEEEEEDEGERSTLKVVGFETSAHAADGAPVPQPPKPQGAVPAPGVAPGAPGAAADVSEIYLQGGVPCGGRVLVAALGIPCPARPAPTHAPLVVSGKMTLSLIPDDETKEEEQDTETLDFKSAAELQDEEIEEEEVEEELEEEVEIEEELQEVKDSGAKSIENEETRKKIVTLEHLEPHQELKSKDKELTYEDTGFDNQDVLASTNASLVPEMESDFSTIERELIDPDECIINNKMNKQEPDDKVSNNQNEKGTQDSEECGYMVAEEISDPYVTGCNLIQTVEGLYQTPVATDSETVKHDKRIPDVSEINALQSDTQEEFIINIKKPTQLVHQLSEISQETVIECENEGMGAVMDLNDDNEDFERLYEANLDAAEELITSVQIPNPQIGDPPLILESESQALVDNFTDDLGSNENLTYANTLIAGEEPLATIQTSKTGHSELEQETVGIDNSIVKNDRTTTHQQSLYKEMDEDNKALNLEPNTLEVAANKEFQPQSTSIKNESDDITAVDDEDIKNNRDVETPQLSQDSEKEFSQSGRSVIIKESDDDVNTLTQEMPAKIPEGEANVHSKVFDQTTSLADENFELVNSEQNSQKTEPNLLKGFEENMNLYDTIETSEHSNLSLETPQSEEMTENFRKFEHITTAQKPIGEVNLEALEVNLDTVETDQIVEDIVDTEQTQAPDTKRQTLNQQITDIDDADSEFDRLLTELGDESVNE